MAADKTLMLAWRLVVETVGVEKNTRKAAESLARMEAGASKAAKGLQGLQNIVTAAAIGKLIKDVIMTADAYQAMANSLRNATASAQELNAVQEALIAQAAQSGTTVEAQAEAFNKLHDATEGLGLSQQEVIDLGGTLSQTLMLSGQNAEQASASVGRFAAAIENGGINLRDFKALLKDSPELIKALASGLGKTVDELRVMADQGKLASDVIVEGLGKAGPEVAAKMAGQVGTIASAFKNAASQFGALIGEFAEGAGVTSGLATMLNDLAGWFARLAKGAQEFGIKFKAAIGQITIYAVNFGQQFILLEKLIALQFTKIVSRLLLVGFLFTKQIAKMEKDLRDRMENNKQLRQDSIQIILEEARAELAALDAADLGGKGAVKPKIINDDQLKVIDSFNEALRTMKQRATDAGDELEALRVEMQSGKGAAESFRAALQAAAAGRELTEKMQKDFADKKMKFGGKEQFGIANTVAELKSQQIELKQTSEAWNLVNAAQTGAMTDAEATAAQIKTLTAALRYLQISGNDAGVNLELFGRAIEKLLDTLNNPETPFTQALADVGSRASDAREQMMLLQTAFEDGAEAADDFRSRLEASAINRDVKSAMLKREADGGPAFSEADQERLAASVEEWRKLNVEQEKLAHSTAIASDALNSTMTEAERAEAQIADLTKSLILLQEKGFNITPEMRARFDEAMQRMRENADIITRTWKEASMAVINTFVDFLAEGSFNVKEFVKSTVSQLSKLIIQMLIVKSIAGTGFGKWLGLAEGGVVSRGSVVPMASGGIVSSPTFFPMAHGNVGLMGEAGPEAVMPLARLSSGKLGVSAEPQNIQVINNTGVQASARIERTANRTSIILEAAQLGAQLAEERITRSMRSGYGATSTALQRTYALRRRG